MPRKKAKKEPPLYITMPAHTGKAKVSSKGWVVIPKAIRDELGIETGDELSFSLRPPLPNMKQDKRLSSIHIIKVPKNRAELVDLVSGIMPRRPGDPSWTENLVKEHRREVEEDEQRKKEARRRRRTA